MVECAGEVSVGGARGEQALKRGEGNVDAVGQNNAVGRQTAHAGLRVSCAGDGGEEDQGGERMHGGKKGECTGVGFTSAGSAGILEAA